MDTKLIAAALSANATVFQASLERVPEKQYRWKPAPEKWSLLEVICHLYDEEREDFRARTRHVLEQPDQPMPPIDPVGWVEQRSYLDQQYSEKVNDFLEERRRSVGWLEQLVDPPWENSYDHPHLGSLSARFFLHNWLAHDYLHIKQITQLKYQYLQVHSETPVSYAGTWK